MNSWYTGGILAFDTETSGLDRSAFILEIGLVELDGSGVVDTWSQMFLPPGIDFENPNVRKAMEVNQITPQDLQGKPTFEELLFEVLDRFASHYVWVAHNADFDLRMIRQEVDRSDPSLPLPDAMVLDTMSLDYALRPNQPRYKLANTAERWGITSEGAAHRAVADAMVCGKVLLEMIKSGDLPEDRFTCESFQKKAAISWANQQRRKWR